MEAAIHWSYTPAIGGLRYLDIGPYGEFFADDACDFIFAIAGPLLYVDGVVKIQQTTPIIIESERRT